MEVERLPEGTTPVMVLANDVGAEAVLLRVVGAAPDVPAGVVMFGKGGTEGMIVAVVTTLLSIVVPGNGLVAGAVVVEKDTVGNSGVVVLIPTLTEVPMIGIDVMTVALGAEVNAVEAVRVALLFTTEDETLGRIVRLVASTAVDDTTEAVVETVPVTVADVSVLGKG
jgi:hypothetical protein